MTHIIADAPGPAGHGARAARGSVLCRCDPRDASRAACEVPVISSNTGGIPELNIQGVTGYLSEIGDIEDMTNKALLILDKNNLPKFKENALKRAKEFDISRILPLYEEYYVKVIEKTRVKVNT